MVGLPAVVHRDVGQRRPVADVGGDELASPGRCVGPDQDRHELGADTEQRLGDWRAAVDGASQGQAVALADEVRAALADDLDAPRALAAVDAWAAGEPGDGSGARLVRDLVDARLGILL